MNPIEANYLLTKKIFQENKDKIIADGSRSKYQQSHRALFYCTKKIDTLLQVIEQVTSENSDELYYFVQVTTRVIVEHFIVGHYIWTKTRIEKNDNCGIEYYAHYRLSELLKRGNYDLGIEGIEANLKNHATFENLQKKVSGSNIPISQSNINEVHTVANRFDIKSIFNYLVNQVPATDHFSGMHKSIAHFLRMYNNLSSFIHNGPSAEFETYHDEPRLDKYNIMKENIAYAQIASRVLKEHILMLFIEEKPEYIELLQPIMDIKSFKMSPYSE